VLSHVLSLFTHLTHPRRIPFPSTETAGDIDAFIDSRALEYPTKLEDEFVERAVNLGVESGMVLDVGTRAGLVALKILWQNENFYAIGMDTSGAMVERARETAAAWELGDRAFFQLGDARRMRFKAGYFDLVVSDSSLHRFDDSLAVLAEIRRVMKPKGALLIRDFRRPGRFQMKAEIEQAASRFGARMRPQIESALRAAYTRNELDSFLRTTGLESVSVVESDRGYVMIERRGETDPNSWIKVREQYL
jgi:ubiquinone/menaquinone biosynthesis C-methylase UbiE